MSLSSNPAYHHTELKALFPNLTDSSIKDYSIVWRRCSRVVKDSDQEFCWMTGEECRDNFDKIKSFLETGEYKYNSFDTDGNPMVKTGTRGRKTGAYKLNDRRSLLIKICKISQAMYGVECDCAMQYCEDLRVDAIDERTMQPATEEEISKMVSEDLRRQIMEYYRERKMWNRNEFIKYVVATITFYQKAQWRNQDFMNTLLLPSAPEIPTENYLDLSTGEMFIVKFKSASSMRTRKFTLCTEALTAVQEFYDTRDKSLTKCYLCPKDNRDDQPKTSGAFSNLMKRMYQTGARTNILRSQKHSEFEDTDPTAEERKAMANEMGHSVATGTTYYPKFSKKLHGEDLGASSKSTPAQAEPVEQAEPAKKRIKIKLNKNPKK